MTALPHAITDCMVDHHGWDGMDSVVALAMAHGKNQYSILYTDYITEREVAHSMACTVEYLKYHVKTYVKNRPSLQCIILCNVMNCIMNWLVEHVMVLREVFKKAPIYRAGCNAMLVFMLYNI